MAVDANTDMRVGNRYIGDKDPPVAVSAVIAIQATWHVSCTDEARYRRNALMLTVGDKLPSFNLQSVVSLEKGKEFRSLSDRSFEGKWLVLFYWPMDFTFVCPTEIAEFGRRNRDFADRGAQVLGASTDTQYVH